MLLYIVLYVVSVFLMLGGLIVWDGKSKPPNLNEGTAFVMCCFWPIVAVILIGATAAEAYYKRLEVKSDETANPDSE